VLQAARSMNLDHPIARSWKHLAGPVQCTLQTASRYIDRRRSTSRALKALEG
jgi:hypothetical protein